MNKVIIGGQSGASVVTGSATANPTAAEISGSAQELQWGVQIAADSANTGGVWVGVSPILTPGTSATLDGYKLGAGQSILVPCKRPNEVYIVCASGTQSVSFLAY